MIRQNCPTFNIVGLVNVDSIDICEVILLKKTVSELLLSASISQRRMMKFFSICPQILKHKNYDSTDKFNVEK